MRFTFIVPCYNAAPNIPALVRSLATQDDKDWSAIFVDDCSTDETSDVITAAIGLDRRLVLKKNLEKKYALRNIVETAREIRGDSIIAVVDGDDQLCNDHAVALVRAAHDRPGSVVWTAHRWDINGMNISKPMPDGVNPYQYPWCSSHLRTFDLGLLRQVPDSNFKDHAGRWFQRGYDQALMLPLLYRASHRRYIPDVCYLYRIKSCSVDDRNWAERRQLQTINIVRSRGYLAV